MDFVSSALSSLSLGESSLRAYRAYRERVRAGRERESSGEQTRLGDRDPIISITSSSFDDAFPTYPRMHTDEHDHPPQHDPEVLDEIALHLAYARARPCSVDRSSETVAGTLECTWGCNYHTDDRTLWELHEANRQPQNFWCCVECRSQQRSGQAGPAYISHSKKHFLAHAMSRHPSQSWAELLRRSAVPYRAPFVESCTFVLGHRMSCGQKFANWKERNDHYVQHFDQRWDAEGNWREQMWYHGTGDIDQVGADVVQPEAFKATDLKPQLPFAITTNERHRASAYEPLSQSEYNTWLLSQPVPLRYLAEETEETQAVMLVHEQHLAFTSRELQAMIRDLVETVTRDFANTIRQSGPMHVVVQSEAERLKEQLAAIVEPLRDCIELFESRGPIAEGLRIARGVAEILLWCAIRQRLEAISANNAIYVSMASSSQGSRQFGLLGSEEYKWLLDIAERNKCMTFGTSNFCYRSSQITYMNALKRVWTDHPRGDYRLSVDLDWSPFCVLDIKPERSSPGLTLSSVITLCGDAVRPYAATCEEYVKRIWPNLGEAVIECVQEAANSDLGTSSTVHKDTQLIATCTMDHTTVIANGPAVALLEVFECAAWLGAACRPSSDAHNIELCVASAAPSSSTDFSLGVSYHFPVERRLDQTSTSTCWRQMFRNPAIALGFPVPLRTAGEEGLEMSIPLLATLGQTFWATNFNGFLLKGFSSISAPVKRIGNSILWHFRVHKDGARMSYEDGDQNSVFRCYSDAIFPGARHFVGWTHVESTTATRSVDYTVIEASETTPTGAGVCVESMLTLQGGQYINVGINIHRATKDRPEHLSFDLYERQIDAASRWAVALSDTRRDCHYLVDGATAILHLSLAWLLSGHVRYAPKGAVDLLRISATNTPESAFYALLHSENRKVKLLESKVNQCWWTFENLAQEYFHIIEQIHNRVSIRDTSAIEVNFANREIIGFDIMDLLLESGPVHPRSRKLQTGSHDWLALSLKLKTVNILASNLGDLVKPMSHSQTTASECGLRDGFCRGLDYLAVTLSTLKSVIGRHCEHTDFALHLADCMYLRDPWSHFTRCACKQTGLDQCTILAKRLESSKGSAGIVSRSHRIFEVYPDGALIFGSRCGRFKRAIKRDRHEGPPTMVTERGQDSTTKRARAETHSSDSGIDVDSTGISSTSESPQYRKPCLPRKIYRMSGRSKGLLRGCAKVLHSPKFRSVVKHLVWMCV